MGYKEQTRDAVAHAHLPVPRTSYTVNLIPRVPIKLAAATSGANAKYRPEIDGLRGIAILAVLLNHVDPHLLPGGYVGVDVFFVISGYLITSLVIRDLDAGTFSFRHFYARRAKRLIPAATVLVAAVVLAAWWVFLPQDFKELGASVAAYSAMLSNVLFWRWDDYFAAQNKVWPFLHTWSLAIEEQFYLVYPMLLWGLSRVRRGTQAVLIGSLAAASFALSEWQAHADPRSAYYLLPGRAWELLAGALCARISTTWCRAVSSSSALGAIGLVMIAVPAFVYSEATVFPGMAALLPVAGTAMLIYAMSTTRNMWTRLLESPFLVATGLISYSLYLWHWPLLVFAKYPWSAAPETFPSSVAYITGVVSVFIAALSYRYVEAPCRRAHMADHRALLTTACASGLLCVVGLIIHQSRGMPSRMPSAVVAYANAASDYHPRRRETIELTTAALRAGRVARIGVQDPSKPTELALWGDSHADSLVPVFDSLATEHGVAGIVLTKGATPPVIGLSVVGGRGSNQDDWLAAAKDVVNSRRVSCVVLAAHWTAYLQPRCVLKRGEETAVAPEAKVALLEKGLRATVALLRDAGVMHVWILEEVPVQRCHVPRALAWAEFRGNQFPQGIQPDEHAAKVSAIARMMASLSGPGVSTLDLAPAMLAAPRGGLLTADGKPTYFDSGHVSVAGTALLRSTLEPIFSTVTERTQ